MDRFIKSIELAIESKNYYAALFTALVIPDICSKLEKPYSNSSGKRYKDWFNRYLSMYYKSNIMGEDVTFLSASDCWALRCSILHEGTDNIEHQSAKETLSQIQFTTLGSHNIRINNILSINVSKFCMDMVFAVQQWVKDIEFDKAIVERIDTIISIRESGYNPVPGVYIE